MINTGRVGLGPPNDYGGALPRPAMLSSLRKQGSRNVTKLVDYPFRGNDKLCYVIVMKRSRAVTGKIDRRGFLGLMSVGIAGGAWPGCVRVYGASTARNIGGVELPEGWLEPSPEFSLAPFWFWNDALSEKEIARQLDDFKAHGVYGFVIHPRAGLPRDIGWMSEPMIKFMRFAIEQAAKREMWVVLYD